MQQFFTGAFIIIFTMLTIMRLYYRFVSLGLRDVLFNRQEGAVVLFTRYIFGIPLFLAVFSYIFHPNPAAWSYLTIPVFLRSAGVLLGFASIYLIYLSHRELGIYFSSKLVIKKGHRLITSGPYRFVRHPMYTAYFALFIAAFLISENWVIGLSGMTVIATLMTLRLGKEEALLMSHFGKSFASYKFSTGMFLPRLSKQDYKVEKEEQSIVQ